MGLESGSLISQLVSSNPVSSDPKNQGDDHIRLIKTVLINDAVAKSAVNTFTSGQIFTGNVRIDGVLSVSTIAITGGASRTFSNLSVLGMASLSAMTVTGPATFSTLAVTGSLTIIPKITLSALEVTGAITTSSLAVLAGLTIGGTLNASAGSFSSITVAGTIPSFIVARVQFRVTASASIAGKSANITSITHTDTGKLTVNVPTGTFISTDAVVCSAKKTLNNTTETGLVVTPGNITPSQVNIMIQRTDANSIGRDPAICSVVVYR